MLSHWGDQFHSSGEIINAGTAVNQYVILSYLGSGGMGQVYLAEDTRLHRRVALKFLPEAVRRDDELRARFLNEARAAAQLSHPNIITIYEIGDFKGAPFIAMELAEGDSLKEIIENSPLPPDKAVEYTIQLCDALSAAHRAGVIHRDIKPSNIHIDKGGKVKILDFGLAYIDGKELSTSSHSTTGTIQYISPEQVKGEKITARSDLFSLGVTLYQMLTGQLPFTGEYEASIVYAIVNEPPPAPSKLRPDIPDSLERILLRLLSKDPQNRHPSAEALKQDLLSAFDANSHPGTVKERRKGLLPMTIIISGVVVAAILFLVIFSSRLFKNDLEGKRVVAVLPFENLGVPEDGYFADGMTDAITTRLAKFEELSVISRASAMKYKDIRLAPQEIGEELGANYLLTGTIYWDKNHSPAQIKVNISLVRSSDGTNLWAESYEKVFDRVFALQADIADDLTRAFRIAVRSREAAGSEESPTTSLAAYDFYLRGIDYFNRSWFKDDIDISIRMFEQAISLDSNFALAYAMLARGHASMYWENYDHSAARLKKAETAAFKSLELDPDLVEGHLALGYYYYHCHLDFQNAMKEFQIALRSQPNNSDLYNAIAAVQRRQGKFDEAVDNFKRALELDPRSHLKAFEVGLTYGMMRRYDESDRYLDRAISIAPDMALGHIYKAWLHILRDGDRETARKILAQAPEHADLARSKYYWWLIRVIEPDIAASLRRLQPFPDTVAYYLQAAQFHRLLGNSREEQRYSQMVVDLINRQIAERPDDARLHSSLGIAYAGLRQREKALGHARKALEILPTSREAFDAPFWAVNLAEILVIFGLNDDAVGQLEFLMNIPGFVSPPYLKLDPLWIPMHGNPRFEALAAGSA
jgi:TolB-like protein/Tfp pilus assembly protein PilF/predicted Ser/Thr protein kinase